MVDIDKVRELAEKYIQCWRNSKGIVIQNRGSRVEPLEFGGIIVEDSDVGCEHLQIFRNNFKIEDFSHDEILKLCVYLTKTLRIQINRDHKIFWSWCAEVALNANIPDNEWSKAFCNLVNLILTRKYLDIGEPREVQLINSHVLQVIDNKYAIAAPLSFSILEGLLRRKKDITRYITKDGKVIQQFSINNTKYRYNKNDRINQIKILFYLAEQHGTLSGVFMNLKREIETIFKKDIQSKGFTDIYKLINNWRNEHQHGNQYWMNKVPVILNIICFLLLQEIEPDKYDELRIEVLKKVQWRQNLLNVSKRAPWEIYPPDL